MPIDFIKCSTFVLQFYDSWKGLCDWLEDSERRMKKYVTSTPNRVKHDLDELRVSKVELSIFGFGKLTFKNLS